MQSGSQCSNRAAGPAAVFALQQSRSPLARIAFNMQLAANGSQHHFARGQTLGSTGLSVQKKTHCTFARPGFVCGARIARFVHLWPKRAILARLRATWWTFSTIFCSWRAISSKHRTFMAYISRRIVHLVQRRSKRTIRGCGRIVGLFGPVRSSRVQSIRKKKGPRDAGAHR